MLDVEEVCHRHGALVTLCLCFTGRLPGHRGTCFYAVVAGSYSFNDIQTVQQHSSLSMWMLSLFSIL